MKDFNVVAFDPRTADQGAAHLTVYTREADGRVSGLTEIACVKELGFKAGLQAPYAGERLQA